MAWKPDGRSNSFLSPPAHLHVCAVTYMTEISLIVTLNNQFSHTHENHIYRIWNEFSFHTVFMKRVRVFITPSLWRGYIKHATSFINTVWNENSFQILFITCLTRKKHNYRVFLPILLRKTRQRRCVTYDVIDELRRISLSKSYSALCHKLIYEIAIFHSINGETCDNILYCLLENAFHVMINAFVVQNLKTVVSNVESKNRVSHTLRTSTSSRYVRSKCLVCL